VKWGYLARNPADAAERPATPHRERAALDPAELNRLIESATAEGERVGFGPVQRRAGLQWATLWTLAIHTGLREGELLALQWADVDLDAGTLTVRHNLVSTHGQVPRYGEPKSQTSRLTIALPAQATQALKAHKARQAEDRLAAADWAGYGLVFCSHIGTPLLRRNVLRAFKLALQRAGLPESIRVHDLRHAHATLMLRAGVPIKTASARLGHSGITITGDLYQHVAADMDAEAAERAAAALSSSPRLSAVAQGGPAH
jgi:integrase